MSPSSSHSARVQVTSPETWLSTTLNNTQQSIIKFIWRVKPWIKHYKFQPVLQKVDFSETPHQHQHFSALISPKALGASRAKVRWVILIFREEWKGILFFSEYGKCFCSTEIFHSLFTNCGSNTSHLSELNIRRQVVESFSQAPVVGAGRSQPRTLWPRGRVPEEETLQLHGKSVLQSICFVEGQKRLCNSHFNQLFQNVKVDLFSFEKGWGSG